jgi:hypothetical protein
MRRVEGDPPPPGGIGRRYGDHVSRTSVPLCCREDATGRRLPRPTAQCLARECHPCVKRQRQATTRVVRCRDPRHQSHESENNAIHRESAPHRPVLTKSAGRQTGDHRRPGRSRSHRSSCLLQRPSRTPTAVDFNCRRLRAADLFPMRGKTRVKRRRLWLLGIASVVAEPVAMKLRGYPIGGKLIVRCRHGHLFTTFWIPGVSLKAVRLGWWRYQRCPVGGHWSLITPVRPSELSEAEREEARTRSDIPLP